MTKLTGAQVAHYVQKAGPPSGTTVAEWVAKARQESQFRTDVQDYLNSGHWGLWQIDEDHWTIDGMPLNIDKDTFRRTIQTPEGNFAAAKVLYARSGWSPWRASGGRPTPNKDDLAAAGSPDSSGDTAPGVVGSIVEGLNPIDDVGDFLKQITGPLIAFAEWVGDPHNWMRVLQVGGGIALGLVAVSIVFKPQFESVVKAVT